ncbi:MAG TPA: hypothetical protein DD672_10700 [Gammaproteobacteria bacterium]|nr:hypothetical protein [Gammaproteobacteria bacterium]HBQ00932.1 hypothetical protein [Gammaproteobacteria bacterium]|tara:strand:- start:191 stop:403 length:213 start_codon:yes stop_codon:yes gene_type:complete
MRTLVFMLLGMTLGAVMSLVLAAAVVFLLPLVTGLDGDEASQGVILTLVVAVTAPVLGLIGAAIGFRKSR